MWPEHSKKVKRRGRTVFDRFFDWSLNLADFAGSLTALSVTLFFVYLIYKAAPPILDFLFFRHF